MDTQDDWLEGVRRWYFGGEAPEGAERDEQPVWPGTQPAAWPATALPARAPVEHACRADACRG